jgi:hypothetical protein
MLISTALLLDNNIRNSVCTPAKLPCRRVEVGYKLLLTIKIFYYNIFTLEQKFSLRSVTSQMEKDFRTANGPIRHLEFLGNFNKPFRTFKALTNNLP